MHCNKKKITRFSKCVTADVQNECANIFGEIPDSNTFSIITEPSVQLDLQQIEISKWAFCKQLNYSHLPQNPKFGGFKFEITFVPPKYSHLQNINFSNNTIINLKETIFIISFCIDYVNCK